jgi:hypothetical protein
MRAFIVLPVVLGLVAIAALPAEARLIEDWPYERLFKEADLAVIAKAGDTTDTKDRFKKKGLETEFIGQETKFEILSVLKGKPADEKSLTLLHYRLPEDVQIADGPILVEFRKEPLKIEGKINANAFKAELGPPEYMLFLKARKDGRYQPVSGDYDPGLSVREVTPPGRGLAGLAK